MIAYTNIRKQYGKQEVLKSISLTIDSPGFHALLGPNGSGKTTLLKSTMGMVHPDSGVIAIDGEELKGNEYRRNIAYLPQIARFPENLSANEFLGLLEKIRGTGNRKEEVIQHFGMQDFMDKPLRSLSGGMRQKVNLVSALMYETPYLFLDEPTIGLDPIALLRLKDWLRKEVKDGKYVVVTTHIMEFVEELADEVVFILEGEIHFKGNLSSLFESTGESDVEHAVAHLLKDTRHA